VNYEINQLVQYAINEGLLDIDDAEYAVNQIIHLLNIETFQKESINEDFDFFDVLSKILEYAYENQLIPSRRISDFDNFEAKLMDAFLPRPADLNRHFKQLYKDAPIYATNYFYHLSQKSNYIKTKRMEKNIHFQYEGQYAPLDISINLSKPEKDPLQIAMKHQSDEFDYPKCPLCMENVGFYGNDDHASRSNHRVVSITINHEKDAWGFQYSPYSYFNEHAIILKKEHIPMQVNSTTFDELIDFINRFPHYFIGSNAGLPIVGGSILNHYHFQGGRASFPIEKARVLSHYKKAKVEIEILDWPLSVIRVVGNNEYKVLDMVNQITNYWKDYTNPDLSIYAYTEVPHNTVTPIVKLHESKYHFYIVLRNNLTTKDRPYGLFHPRESYFHIKKENIGLIEVMGLAILPGRLESELDEIKNILLNNENLENYPHLNYHRDWILSMQRMEFDKDSIDEFLHEQVGSIFEKVLEDCGVFKKSDRKAFIQFVEKAIL
jgi:UDPglucose--hexose-1-phosphate uridylyltransferase